MSRKKEQKLYYIGTILFIVKIFKTHNLHHFHLLVSYYLAFQPLDLHPNNRKTQIFLLYSYRVWLWMLKNLMISISPPLLNPHPFLNSVDATMVNFLYEFEMSSRVDLTANLKQFLFLLTPLKMNMQKNL